MRASYERLWDELTAEEEFGVGERSRLQEHLKRLNERGFDVEEVELEETEQGYRLRVRPQVVEAGHYRRRLQRLPGSRRRRTRRAGCSRTSTRIAPRSRRRGRSRSPTRRSRAAG